jgi:hypothetical protein
MLQTAAISPCQRLRVFLVSTGTCVSVTHWLHRMLEEPQPPSESCVILDARNAREFDALTPAHMRVLHLGNIKLPTRCDGIMMYARGGGSHKVCVKAWGR